MSILAPRKVVIFLACALLLAVAGHAFGQFGTNAPVCSNGHCAPGCPWGWTKPRWNLWPGAVYPDMIKAQPRAAGEIPPTQIELPNPANEAEIQSPASGAESARPAPQSGPPAGPLGGLREPTRAKSPAESFELPALEEPRGAPRTEPSGSINRTEQGTAPRADHSGAIPRSRLRTGGFDSLSDVPDVSDL